MALNLGGQHKGTWSVLALVGFISPHCKWSITSSRDLTAVMRQSTVCEDHLNWISSEQIEMAVTLHHTSTLRTGLQDLVDAALRTYDQAVM